jgi:tRNA C32,U32 (ribose-2'-O)-methylase TrmJ
MSNIGQVARKIENMNLNVENIILLIGISIDS